MTAAEQVASAAAVLIDWDGCLASGGALLPGARALLLALGPRSYILSNNSTDLPGDLMMFLERAQVRIDASHVFLAGHQTLCRQAISTFSRRIHLVASPQMITFAASIGIGLDADQADTVVILRDIAFTFAKLEAAANAARRCERIVLANPDLTHPAPDGKIAAETGAIFAAIQACLGDHSPTIDIVGKPSPELFKAALDRAGVAAHRAVMIGDNPDTDGAGAAACGIPFIQVHPGGPLTMEALAAEVSSLLEQLPIQSSRR